jgi:acetate kinase
MSDIIPVLNGGSSSLKFSIFEIVDEQSLTLRITGQIEGLGRSPHFVAKNEKGELLEERHWENADSIDHNFLFGFLVGWATGQISGSTVRGVGHRVVHGGLEYDAPVVIDDHVVETLEKLCPLAPLHLPYNLNYIKTARSMNPQIPQVACFDTAFHRSHPKMADLFALPRAYYDEGIRRYGFHGLSYEYIARVMPEVAPEIAEGRVIVGHLGSGVSMCALNNGRSIDSTMSFTALDGLPMGTRPGALDAGVVLHLIREKNMTADDVEKLLYGKCGLLGLSGISNDMRDLETSSDPNAREAIDFFVYRASQELGSLAAAMGGVDGIVFTAGIGEHSPEIRAGICRAAQWMGVELDEAANEAGGPRISTVNSPVSAWVIPTDEERMMALHTLGLISKGKTTAA